MQRVRIIFKGHVQGVGFRYGAKQAADQRLVSGYVKNLENGNVEMVVEGEMSVIDNLIEEIEQSNHGHISEKTIEKSPFTGQFQGFEIRR